MSVCCQWHNRSNSNLVCHWQQVGTPKQKSYKKKNNKSNCDKVNFWIILVIGLLSAKLVGEFFLPHTQLVHDEMLYEDTVSLKPLPVKETVSTMGSWIDSYSLDGNWLLISNKLTNIRVRADKGNRENRSIIKLAHWNMGNSHWARQPGMLETRVQPRRRAHFICPSRLHGWSL